MLKVSPGDTPIQWLQGCNVLCTLTDIVPKISPGGYPHTMAVRVQYSMYFHGSCTEGKPRVYPHIMVVSVQCSVFSKGYYTKGKRQGYPHTMAVREQCSIFS